MAHDVFPPRQARIPASNSYDRALAAAISRHYSDTEVADTIKQALEALARACWEHAGRTVSPFEDDSAARALILKALRENCAPNHPVRGRSAKLRRCVPEVGPAAQARAGGLAKSGRRSASLCDPDDSLDRYRWYGVPNETEPR